LLLPIAATILTIAIFAVDAFTPLSMAVAVLYVIVIIMAATFSDRRELMVVAAGCAALTLLAFSISHGTAYESAAFARCLVSIAAIAITTLLVDKNKVAEAVLREQANLLDVTHDAVFVRDANDVIRYWNRAAEELYGWNAQEAIGQVSHQLMATVFPLPLKDINATLMTEGRWEGEIVHTKRDGQQVTVASRWSLQRPEAGRPMAVLETNNDVSERRRAENALRRSEAHLAEAQRLSRTGSFNWNPVTGNIDWSDETYRIFELDPAVKPTAELILARAHPADRAAVGYLLQHAGEDRVNWQMEHRLLMADGSTKHVSVMAHADKDASGGIEFVGAVMDVTSTRRAEAELQQAQTNLAHVNRVSTLGEMTASIAHEVSQPIAAILANAGAGVRWLAAGNQSEANGALSRIVKDGHRASDVISRIRTLSKKMPPRKQRLDVNEAILEVVSLVRAQAERSRTSVIAELGSDLPIVSGDRVQLQQVVLNLIANAIEAMNSNEDGPRELVITSGKNGADSVVVSVRDTGPGLTPEQLSRVFDAFYTTKDNGLGMGLAICRSIIDAHDGKLWATQNEPRGAVMQFSLRGIA
jgi:PAS domain S-box-containing protein